MPFEFSGRHDEVWTCISDRWEGSMEGEKCIQHVKRNFHGF